MIIHEQCKVILHLSLSLQIEYIHQSIDLDYDSTQATATHNYYGNNNRRTNHANRMHDLSSGYYYDQTST